MEATVAFYQRLGLTIAETTPDFRDPRHRARTGAGTGPRTVAAKGVHGDSDRSA
jgi:hypothetical protein